MRALTNSMVSEASIEPSIIALALRKEIEFASALVKPGTKGEVQSAIRWMTMRMEQLENEGRSTSNAQNNDDINF